MSTEAATVNTANEFNLYVQGFDDGATAAWRTMAELVRAGVGPEDLTTLILTTSCQGTARSVTSSPEVRH